MRRTCLILSILAGCTGKAVASLSSLVGAWGHDFVVSTFEPEAMMVATATDKSSGERFKIIRRGDGRMMTLVPIEKMAKMSFDDAMTMMK